MRVKLRALEGIHRGREFVIPTPLCMVGRGEECDLRPVSPEVSRRHCAIQALGGNVFVQDLHSRNGTFVNGDRIEGNRSLNSGDKLKIGRLLFEIVIDHSVGGAKKAKVKSIKEAARRVVSNNPNEATIDENDVTDWIDEADQMERERRSESPESRVFHLEETHEAPQQDIAEPRTEAELEQRKRAQRMRSDKHAAKLPRPARSVAGDSSEAAAKALQGFFGSR